MPTYEERNPQAEAALRKIADKLKAQMPPNMGFTLFLFTYGKDGQLFYISSADREDMIKVVKEWMEKQKEEVS